MFISASIRQRHTLPAYLLSRDYEHSYVFPEMKKSRVNPALVREGDLLYRISHAPPVKSKWLNPLFIKNVHGELYENRAAGKGDEVLNLEGKKGGGP